MGTPVPVPALQHRRTLGPAPTVLDFFGDTFNALAWAAWATVIVAIAVRCSRPLAGSVPAKRTVWASSPLALAFLIPVLTVVLAWWVGQFVNSWNPRYLGIAVVPALIPLAAALARVRWGSAVLYGTVAAFAFTSIPVVVDRSVTVDTSKSDAAYLLAKLRPVLRPGALVISTEVTDLPVLSLDLGPGFRYATPFGLLKDPLVVDWSNLSRRLKDSSAASDFGPLLGSPRRRSGAGGEPHHVGPRRDPEAYAGR